MLSVLHKGSSMKPGGYSHRRYVASVGQQLVSLIFGSSAERVGTSRVPSQGTALNNLNTPVYISTYQAGGLQAKLKAAWDELKECRACPRRCGVDRIKHADGKHAMCMVGRKAVVSSAFAHRGEEACLQGWNGSGTIFFGGCNLRCVFCQNWKISQQRGNGKELNATEIADLMMELQDRDGCHNINFVTPEHVVPQVVEAVADAVSRGLQVPIVYNTSAYDSVHSLRLMEGLIDVYMPDFKFWDSQSARRLSKAADYPEVARESILEMHRQVGDLAIGSDGLAKRGLLVRHLVMPNLIDESTEIMRWLATHLSKDTYVNIMDQYRPQHLVGKKRRLPQKHDHATHETSNGQESLSATPNTAHASIDRRVSSDEWQAVVIAAREAGLWRFAHEVPKSVHRERIELWE